MSNFNPKAILSRLNINRPGVWIDHSTYQLELKHSVEWGCVESELDLGVARDLLTKIDEESFITDEGAVSVYSCGDEATMTLTADFESDTYMLEVAVL